MDLGWYVRRLQRMSGGEIFGRCRDHAVRQAWRWRLVRPRCPALRGSIKAERLTLPGLGSLAIGVAPEAVEMLLAEGNRILAGKVTVLNHESAHLGESPDWFVDLRTGRRASSRRFCFDITYMNALESGEIKYVWEPSRHHHLTVLAAAFYVSGDVRYAERVSSHLNSWFTDNWFPRGIHWVSGIEIGIRLISWVWLRRLLSKWDGAPLLFEKNPNFVRQLYDHQLYLAMLPSHGSSANNHLVAELAGLFASASAFPLFRETGRWRRWAAARIEREVDNQVYPDGLNRELATAYHGFVMELFLLAAIEDDTADPMLGCGVWDKLAAMADALASLLDASGRPPRQGDDDGAIALLVDGPPFDRWISLLSVCRFLVGDCDWWPQLGGNDLRAALLASCIAPHLCSDRPAEPIRHFVEGGVALLRDERPNEQEIWCRFDHGPIGFLSMAAHGHADALSIELRHGGVDVLCDPGTYCYHGHDKWRTFFRSTIGHNTLELDGCDQSVSGGLFMWAHHARSALEHAYGLNGGDVAEVVARHEGYSRLPTPAVHRRRITFDRRTRIVDIFDQIDSDSQHQARLAYHLGPRVECRLHKDYADLSWPTTRGRAHATLSLPSALTWSLLRGQHSPIMGWYSSGFGLISPTSVLLGVGVVGSEELHTSIHFNDIGCALDKASVMSIHLERSTS